MKTSDRRNLITVLPPQLTTELLRRLKHKEAIKKTSGTARIVLFECFKVPLAAFLFEKSQRDNNNFVKQCA